jgi:DNA-binding response OmpR family regulator
MRIALLDNDKNQCKFVADILQAAGHTSHPFENTKELIAHLRSDVYDMLIIHWDSPDAGGEKAVHWARENLAPELPILFIASIAEEDDIIAGLAAGANDYIIKPLRRGEMIARAQALLRRAYPARSSENRIAFGTYIFDTRTTRISMNGNPVELTQKEFDLALLFFRNPGRPLSRAYILDAVWARELQVSSRTMDTHVSRIRSKLHLRPEHGYRLAPVYSYGYRLEKITD